jgi:collagen type III alpha
VDGNGDGVKDRYDPEDAIPGAANYLKLSGAPEDYYSAIFSYNRADWYVRDVLAQADEYRAAAGEEDGGGGGSEVASSVLDAASGTAASLLSPFATREAHAQEAAPSGAAFPLPDGNYDYDDTWGASRGAGRTHEGTDVFAPEGTTLHSVTDGTVVQVSGADSQGWNYLGGWTVMIEASESVGPVQAGDTLYYAHMREPSTLPVGTTVRAGDPIGHVGSTGEGPPGTLLQPASRGQHLHLGWYDPTGERAEAASGAMNPYPLLQWLEGSDGKVEAGEVVPGSSSSLAQPVALGPPGSSDPLPAYCLPLRTFGLLPSSPQPATGPTEAGDPSSAPALGSGEAEDLLSNPNFVPSEAAEGDLRAGIVDARLVSLLQAITEKHMIEVSVFKTGHPYGPYLEEIGLADVPNSHWSGKTADITDIDGKPVMGNGTDPDVLDVGRMVFALPLGSRPDEVTGPTAWVAELGYDREDGMITDYEFTSAHEDHLHVGWGP